jgi:hypothetical protein
MVFVISAQVSVKAQKYGGLKDHPIGRVSGRPIKGSDNPSLGKTTARVREACRLIGMR